MSVEVKIPEIGESITEALISRWFKSPGDWIDEDEPIAELETDKVTVELPSPAAGRIESLAMGEGDTAQVGDVIAVIDNKAKKTAGDEAPAEPAPVEEKPAPSAPAAAASATSEPDPEQAPSGKQAARVMPAAQRLLSEHGLSPSDITGSGPGGRILKEDVERLVASKRGAPKVQASESPGSGGQETPAAPPTGERVEEAVAMTPIRKRIAERLVSAQENAALLTTFNEIDMTAVKRLRKKYQESFVAKNGFKLGFMSFFVKASIEGLREFPQINAEIRDEHIIYRNYYDVGIAVSTPRGLMVPVVRNAERLSFAEIENTISEYAGRAREGKIQLADLEGGTFTITNGGIFGSMLSTPIINPPQSGVLGLHAIQDRPVVLDGEIVIRPMMYVALTYDHRIVDGREAVTFLRRVKETIEDPTRILLEV